MVTFICFIELEEENQYLLGVIFMCFFECFKGDDCEGMSFYGVLVNEIFVVRDHMI